MSFFCRKYIQKTPNFFASFGRFLIHYLLRITIFFFLRTIWIREFCFRFCAEFANQFWRNETGPLYTVKTTTHSSIDWIKQATSMLLFDLSHYTAKERRSFYVSLFTDLIIYFYDLYRGNLSGRQTFRVTIRFDCSSRMVWRFDHGTHLCQSGCPSGQLSWYQV